jgi:hypothetical protein
MSSENGIDFQLTRGILAMKAAGEDAIQAQPESRLRRASPLIAFHCADRDLGQIAAYADLEPQKKF